MKIALGADHAGFELKEHLRALLEQEGHEVRDFGTDSCDSTDYPDYARPVAESVARGNEELGLLVCGTGTGMAIAANKIDGVRAANCWSPFSAEMARAHNNANVLALPARLISVETAEETAHAFLEASFEGGRHARRVGKINALEGNPPDC